MKERLIGDDQLLVTADTTLGDALWDWVAADAARRAADGWRIANIGAVPTSMGAPAPGYALRPAGHDGRRDVDRVPPLSPAPISEDTVGPDAPEADRMPPPATGRRPMSDGEPGTVARLRVALPDDAEAIEALQKASIAALFGAFYSADQTASSVEHVAHVDRVLLGDGTYFVIEGDDGLVACGGWSRRGKLYTGSGDAARRRPDHRPGDRGGEGARDVHPARPDAAGSGDPDPRGLRVGRQGGGLRRADPGRDAGGRAALPPLRLPRDRAPDGDDAGRHRGRVRDDDEADRLRARRGQPATTPAPWLRGTTTATRPARPHAAASARNAASMGPVAAPGATNARIVDPAPDRHDPSAPASRAASVSRGSSG